MMIATSTNILCLVHVEMIYNDLHAYGTIVIHFIIWYAGVVYSKYITTRLPVEIIYLMSVFMPVQMLLYKYRAGKEIEDTKRRILLEISESNIFSLINAVPEGIVVIDINSQVLMKNEAYQRLMQNIEFHELKVIEKYRIKDSVYHGSLSESIFNFKKSEKKSINFGVFTINSVYLECTGTKIA